MPRVWISHFILFPRRRYKETYRSFVDALTEIERLLIMRNNPPAPPTIRMIDTTTSSSSSNNHHNHRRHYYYNENADYYPSSSSSSQQQQHATPGIGDCVLGSDDLGMLMLHIHELRTIMWQERRRFSPTALRSVSEDLAELTGTIQNCRRRHTPRASLSLSTFSFLLRYCSHIHFIFFLSRFSTITIRRTRCC